MTPKSTTRPRIYYKSLPKVELHRHLEGSLRLTTMIETAREFDLDIPYKEMDDFRPLVQVQDGEPFTFSNFLSKFQTLRLFYQSPEVINKIAHEVVADAAADNVRYLEIRFTPVALTRIRDFPLGEAMDWVISSAKRAAKEYGINTRLIASVNRHESPELAEEVIKLAIDRKRKGIVGIDLAGSEAEFSGEPFMGIFREAKEEGMKITIHAGEWSGAENVAEAINELGADRIGHGVRVVEDKDVVALAAERKIPFEVCVTSNHQSGSVTSLEEHPVVEMMDSGLNVTINTDDPSISQIDLSDEYELVCENQNMSIYQLQDSILAAARAAFLSKKAKGTLVKSIEEELLENSTEAA